MKSKFFLKEIKDKIIWERFLLSQKPQSFLQSWNWGEVNQEMGDKVFRFAIYEDSKIVGLFQLLKENAKRGPHLLLPAGPILDWKNNKLVEFFINELRVIAKREKVWFVRIRPELVDTLENRKLFKKLGMSLSPMHLNAENTWILNLEKSEEELLSGMRKTTRYLVKKGLGEDLNIEISKDPQKAKLLFDLQKETVIRHKFVGFPQKLFEKEIELFGRDNTGRVFICKMGRKVLAVAIIIFYGDYAYYHFSGSTSDYSKVPFSYRLQWEIIKYAKRIGKKAYNFWGIAPNDNPKHRFYGVTIFKTGFGGERIDWLHAHDLVVNPLYWATYTFETLRKIARGL